MHKQIRQTSQASMLLMLAALLIVNVTPAAGQVETVLYSFNDNGASYAGPYQGITFDSAGNLYGTTRLGGRYNQGTVFELMPQAGGGWTEKVLHSFSSKAGEGIDPNSGLLFDSSGNLYGTAQLGGTSSNGTAFRLTPQVDGTWKEKTIYNFAPVIGGGPAGKVIFDSAGNLYGEVGCEVFELTPTASGWKEKVLRVGPYVLSGSLVFDAAGNLYGVASTNFQDLSECYGVGSCGAIFELTPQPGGTWTETILRRFNFKSARGNYPWALTIDSAGNLYGTAMFGGMGSCVEGNGCGTVFQLSPTKRGEWNYQTLYFFTGTDGDNPIGLVWDSSGKLYGATEYGGTGSCVGGGSLGCGTVFELTPTAGGGWTETTLYSFRGPDGYEPLSAPVVDADGNLYGTTVSGGNYNDGVAYEITP
jgi:uncharacterized repeat protein (TIGR03803 family)